MAVLGITVVVYGAYNAFGVFFKPVLTEFGWTRAMTSGGFSLSWIVHGLRDVIMGRLTDRFGPTIVMTLCGFLLGLGYLLMSQISALWQSYIFYRLIIGAGMEGCEIRQLSGRVAMK
ncbi:MFS transporter [Chloroflexota bacterium]